MKPDLIEYTDPPVRKKRLHPREWIAQRLGTMAYQTTLEAFMHGEGVRYLLSRDGTRWEYQRKAKRYGMQPHQNKPVFRLRWPA